MTRYIKMFPLNVIILCLIVLAGCLSDAQSDTEKMKLIEATSSEWLYTNGPWKQVSVDGWGDVMQGWQTSMDRRQYGRNAKIETDSPIAILKHRQYASPVSIYVDGKLVIDNGISSESNEITIFRDLTGWHEIEVAFASVSEISGLYVSQDANVKKPNDNRKKLVVMGHSYIDGTGSSNRGVTSITPVLGDILGVESINQGIGRTDVDVSVSPTAKNSGLDRVQADVIQLNPDYVLSVYGFNAAIRRIDPDQYQADYAQYLTTMRDALPDTPLFVSGMIAIPAKSDEANAAYNQAMMNACASVAGCTYIDLSNQWNKDNFSEYVNSDGIHPNDAGYRFMAEQYAKVISSVIRLSPQS